MYQNFLYFLLQYINDQTAFFEKVTGHYEILNAFAYDLKELSKSAVDNDAKRKLLEIQGIVYGVLCTVKTFLRSQNKDPDSKVPSGGNRFHNYDRCDQHESEYRTMLNGYSIAEYLDVMYSTILNFQN